MAIGITGANNGYSRTAADNRFLGRDGGTINGNLTVTGTLSTTLLEAISANITILDIRQYELSGFNVSGNATVQGTISASGNLITASGVTAGGGGSFNQDVTVAAGGGRGFKIGGAYGMGSGFGWTSIVPDTVGLFVGYGFNINASPLLSRYAVSFLNTGTQSKLAIGLDNSFNSAVASLSTLTFYVGSSATMSLTDNGRVGIGTSTPASVLDIPGSGDTSLGHIIIGKANHGGKIRFRRGSDGAAAATLGYDATDGGPGFQLNSGGGSGTITLLAAGGPVNVYSANVNPFSFAANGNFGVGTIYPNAKVDVLDTTLAGSTGLSGSILNLTQTWATSGAPTSIRLDVTDTSSSASSLLMDLRIGSRSSYSFGKTTLTLPPSANSGIVWPGVSLQNQTCSITRKADDSLDIVARLGGGKYITIGGDGYGLGIFNGFLRLNTGLREVYLSADDNNIFAQRNSGSPQAYRLYNTYSNATTFERLNLRWVTNVIKIGTEKGAAGGAARDLAFETDATTRMHITSAGNIGIGTTIPPALLTLNAGTISYDYTKGLLISYNGILGPGTGGLGLWHSDGGETAEYIDSWYNSAAAAIYFRMRVYGTPLTAMTILGSGNVGIGTTSPAGRLHLADTTLAGSGALSGSVLNLTQTWDTTSTPTAIKLNVTNNNSGAASNLLDLQVGGSSRFSIRKDGAIAGWMNSIFGGGIGNLFSGRIHVGDYNFSVGSNTNTRIAIEVDGSDAANALLLNNEAGVYWSSLDNTANIIALRTGADLALRRDTSNTLAQRNGVNPQAFRLYNTYTDPISAFERLNIKWDANVIKIGTEKGSVGGAARAMELQTDGATRMHITSAGNIGIATTAPGNILHLDCTLNKGILLTNSTQAPGRANYFINAGNGGAYNCLNISESYDNILYGHIQAYARSLYLGGFANATSVASVTVLNDQNKLDLLQLRQGLIGSSTVFKVASSGDTTIYGTVSAVRYLGLQDSLSGNPVLVGGNSTGSDLLIGTNDNYALNLETAGTTKMSITSAGFVGIGVAAPSSILDINDSTGSQKNVTLSLRNGSFGWWAITSSNSNTSGFLRFASNNSGQTPLTLDGTTGNVGIANNNPTAKLDILDNTLASSGGLQGSALSVTQTWATSGSPTLIYGRVTNTSSGAASNLIDLGTVANGTLFKVTKAGNISFGQSVNFTQGFEPSSNTSFNIRCYGTTIGGFAATDQPQGLHLNSSSSVVWTNAAGGIGSFASVDLYLNRRGPANLRIGAVDAAAPVAQTLSVQSVVAGTTNTAGSNFTIAGSQGTGTGAGGSIIFQTAPAGSSGTAQNGLSAALTIDSFLNTNSTSNFVVPNVSGKGFWVTGSPTHGGMVNAGGLGGVDFRANAETVLSLVNNAGQRRTAIHINGQFGFHNDITLARDAANTLAQRNDVNPQAFRLYNTFTDTVSAFERLNIKWDANVLKIGTEKGSTGGVARNLAFVTDNTTRMTITSSGFVGIGVVPTETQGESLYLSNIASGTNTTYLRIDNINSNGSIGVRLGSYASKADFYYDNVTTQTYLRGLGSALNIGTFSGDSNAYVSFTSFQQERMRITGAGNVGIGITAPAEKLDVVGNVKISGHLSAATKSFLIDHPTKEGKKLQYGVVESNQHSVLVRGKTAENIIELPEEWTGLVHEDSVTVQLTPIGSYQQLFVISQDNQRVVVGGSTGQYNYTIYGERKDVDKLQTIV